MPLRTLLTTVALGTAALIVAPAHASPPPCDAYMCLAGDSGVGGSGGPACVGLERPFFDIVIYDHTGIDYPATALARSRFLSICPGATTAANAGILATIIARWGEVIK